MAGFLELLKEQRWDDHRYYHHSTINQSLHLLSAMSFVCAYLIVFKDPAASALTGWLVVIAHPTGSSGATGEGASRTKCRTLSTEAPFAFAVLMTERKAA